MNHTDLQELIAPYALGTLAAEETTAVEAHLSAGCADCEAALRNAHWAVAALALSVDSVKPPALAKHALLARIGNRTHWSWRPTLALAAGLLVAIGVFRVWRPTEAVLEIVGTTGQITVSGQPATAGRRIKLGEPIIAAKGKSDFRLADRVAFRLNEGTSVVIRRSGPGYVLKLARGAVLSVVKPGTTYAVHTPVVAAAVRGTVFYAGVDSPRQTTVCVCQGTVRIDALGQSEDVTAAGHTAASWRGRGGRVRKGAPGLLDHSDQDIETLRAFLPE